MDINCKKCREITAFEQRLDARVEAIVQKVRDFCRPVRERNNERWKKFAKLCRKRFIGNIIFNRCKTPHGLEIEPDYLKTDWYKKEGNLIEIEAMKLEEMKKADLKHWGYEDLSPMDASDPGGYYTPSRAPRKECYARGLKPFLPAKYDFSTSAGTHKFETDKLVLCSKTKKAVPVTKCNWETGVHTKWKPIYWLKDPDFFDKSVPAYNEWRDDAYYQKHPELRRS